MTAVETSSGDEGATPAVASWSIGLLRGTLLVFGLVLPQAILYGESLVGRTILLPLDTIANIYRIPDVAVHDSVLTDQVFVFEYWRRFSASELRAGRFPLWNPQTFAGAPSAVIPTYSPFNLLYALWPSPFSLAWIELAKALVVGVGAFLFLRRAVAVSYWPAAIAAWCLPLTGFFIVWQGYYSTCTAVWLPWLLLAVHSAATRSGGGSLIAVAVVTAVTFISGQPDIALQALLASGLYAVWLLLRTHGVWRWRGSWNSPILLRVLLSWRAGLRGALVLALGWLAGFLLAAPHLLPLLDYIPTGARMVERAKGGEDRPPTGVSALPQIVLPDCYGRTNAEYIGNLCVPESAAAAYPGLLAALLLAPLAWCLPGYRAQSCFWLALILFVLSWTLHVPVVVQLLRAPGLNMLSHNRFVFVSAFATLVLAALGMEAVVQRLTGWRWWFPLPMLLSVGLAIWCVYQLQVPPEETLRRWFKEDALAAMFGKLARVHWKGLILTGVVLLGWAVVALRLRPGWLLLLVLVPVMLVEYLDFGRAYNPQCDPALYYPEPPMLASLREQPGRVLGIYCWDANLLPFHGLRDVRGYDAVDPARILQMLALCRDKDYRNPSYAQTQWYVPHYSWTTANKVRLPAVLDMLNVRWLIFAGKVPNGVQPAYRHLDYWAVENHAALPRVFVPARAVVATTDETLEHMQRETFDPREVAYVPDKVAHEGHTQGAARVVTEVAGEVIIEATMETPGLVVLGEQWYPGWRATVNDERVEVLPTNHALCGVQVPAGRSSIVLRYQPAGFHRGVLLMGGTLVLLMLVAGVSLWRARAH